ncbi:MAG: glycosyltransferase family 2 protein, partial [Eubacterium sp.]|nr:glycosyltransferase family 2 protein [Eubacterium sp.]
MEISVITPFHNVDPKYFEACFASMVNQTYGIENIEWIIVLHNCEQKYIDYVKEKAKKYPGILTPVLNNEARTPSSPRNYGLTLATGRYVGFLDGDDRYCENCIETSLSYLHKTGAEICGFRRKIELEDSDRLALNEGILWETDDYLLVNKDNWDGEKLFVSIWGMVTSKIYLREFLEKNHLRFHEEIFFGEDATFNLEAYPLARNICLMQYVGYVYFINGDSLVQVTTKSETELINYAHGMIKTFEIGMKNGCYMNNMIGGLLYHMSRFLEVSDISLEGKEKIRDLFLPYIRIVKPFDVCKIYTEEDVKLRYDYPKNIMLNLYDGENTREKNPVYAGELKDGQTWPEGLEDRDAFTAAETEADRYFEAEGPVDEHRLQAVINKVLHNSRIAHIRIRDGKLYTVENDSVAGLYYFQKKDFKEYRE